MLTRTDHVDVDEIQLDFDTISISNRLRGIRRSGKNIELINSAITWVALAECEQNWRGL